MPSQLLQSLTIAVTAGTGMGRCSGMRKWARNTLRCAAVLVLTGVAAGPSLAQGMPYGSVKSWQVNSGVEVSKTETFDDHTATWSFKANGTALIDSTMPEGMRYMWGTPNIAGGMPNANNAYNGKGAMEFKYQATYKRVSASAANHHLRSTGLQDLVSFRG